MPLRLPAALMARLEETGMEKVLELSCLNDALAPQSDLDKAPRSWDFYENDQLGHALDLAAGCLVLAEIVDDDSARAALLQMADDYRALAAEIDNGGPDSPDE